VARDNLSDDSGDYTLSLAVSGSALSVSPGDQGGNIAFASPVNGTISLGELDAWTFTAASGAKIALTLTDTAGGDFDPDLQLLSPSGKSLVDNYSDTKVSSSLTLSEGGLYTIIVRDNLSDDAGSYQLSLAYQ